LKPFRLIPGEIELLQQNRENCPIFAVALTIASVTFGATRVFVLKHKRRDDVPTVKLPLEAGSVLLMKGPTQHFWKHGLLKQTKPCGPRVNLTFRTIYDR